MGEVTEFPINKPCHKRVEFIGFITTDDDSFVIKDPDDIALVMDFISNRDIMLYRTEVSNDG